ncbi:MAG: hypothetical protein HY791_02800 [Deltaproteobacteria bacterium]|nr:hypothetical protein [Deltaproteobacteria bacterium]
MEIGPDDHALHIQCAPYLDCRPLTSNEPANDAILNRSELSWIGRDAEAKAKALTTRSPTSSPNTSRRSAVVAHREDSARREGPTHQRGRVLGPSLKLQEQSGR